MSSQIIRGSVHKFGDDINTDLISPARYMELDNAAIAAHAMEGADPEFAAHMHPGDIIVGGNNFGSGSSRETAPIALKGCGVSVVIAKFFARIFYRNCINIGLPVMICEDTDLIAQGDVLEVEPLRGVIRDLTTGQEYHCKPLPENIMEIVAHGGLLGNLEYQMNLKGVE
ncbi:MAG: 3-isopropylmalate dehydratase small subunit [Pseudoflavonifractor sp.]